MNVSEIKAGDKIYFQGNQGKVMRVISDENEPLLEVVLTQKRVAYLNPSQLDLYPFAEQLNENQRQVLGWLKIGHCDGDSVFEALERITYVYEDQKTEKALESLSPDQEVQVINSFMKWALEQEEEE